MNPQPQTWNPLGVLLVERRFVSEQQLQEALRVQNQTGDRLGDIFVARGDVSRDVIDALVREQHVAIGDPGRGFGTGLRAEIARRGGDPATTSARLPGASIDREAIPTSAESRDVDALVFVPSPDGYALQAWQGALPGPGSVVDVKGRRFHVARIGASPLPGDERPCIFLSAD